MDNVKRVHIKRDEKVESTLLLVISKLSLTQPKESLELLAMCANEDIPKSSILNYALDIVEGKNHLS